MENSNSTTLKKTGLELIHNNYHPLLNLCFISKLIVMYAQAATGPLQLIQPTSRLPISLQTKLQHGNKLIENC